MYYDESEASQYIYPKKTSERAPRADLITLSEFLSNSRQPEKILPPSRSATRQSKNNDPKSPTKYDNQVFAGLTLGRSRTHDERVFTVRRQPSVVEGPWIKVEPNEETTLPRISAESPRETTLTQRTLSGPGVKEPKHHRSPRRHQTRASSSNHGRGPREPLSTKTLKRYRQPSISEDCIGDDTANRCKRHGAKKRKRRNESISNPTIFSDDEALTNLVAGRDVDRETESTNGEENTNLSGIAYDPESSDDPLKSCENTGISQETQEELFPAQEEHWSPSLWMRSRIEISNGSDRYEDSEETKRLQQSDSSDDDDSHYIPYQEKDVSGQCSGFETGAEQNDGIQGHLKEKDTGLQTPPRTKTTLSWMILIRSVQKSSAAT